MLQMRLYNWGRKEYGCFYTLLDEIIRNDEE